jgi:hypothetical protein
LDTHVTPPLKDEEAQHPVAGVWRGPLREVVHAFARGDYGLARRVSGVEAVDPETAEHIRANVADYGATLVDLPEETWNTSVAQWQGTHWEVLVDLWTAEEGPSDLVLHCDIRQLDDEYRIKVHLVYVP